MKTYTWGLVSIPLMLAVQTALAGNLITDGGFEGGVMPWTSTKSILTLDPVAAYAGQAGMKVDSAYAWCPYGALYTLNTSQLQNGTLYEFGARIRLANNSDTFANHQLGLIKNGSNPIWLDGEQSSYDGGAYPGKWTSLFGAWKASFAPTDNLKLCISGAANKPFHVDNVFATPLTTAEIGYQPPTTLDAATHVYADGNRLVMGSQKTPFLMKGINVYLHEAGNDAANGSSLNNFKYKNVNADSYKEIRDLGFNAVRLMLSFNLFEENAAPGVYKEEGWALVDRHIQWAKQNNLRLILDMHIPQGGYQSINNTGFGTNATLKTRLENLWKAIAQRYRNETTVVAYDLINEPHVNGWFAYAQTLISKIRTVDANKLIIVEESFHPSDVGMYKLTDNNILYDTHWYEPWTWAGSLDNNTPYTGTLEQFKQQVRTVWGLRNFYDSSTDRFTVPINIGEYGITYTKYETPGVNGVTWLQHANAAFDSFGFSRQLFHYNEGKFGIYRNWNSYPNENTVTTTDLKAALPAINGAEPPPPSPALDITTTSLYGGTVGAAYSAQASANGGTSPYTWSLATGSLPTGLTLSSDGKITGTPTTAGTFSFTLVVTDQNAATDTQAISMSVAAQPVALPPDITTTGLTAGTAGTAYSATLTANNGTDPYSWSVDSGSLPVGLSLSTVGVISGTPSTSGTASFSVQVTDSKGLSDTQALSITVATAPPPPPASGNADMALTTFTATAVSVNKGNSAGFNFVLKNNGNDLAKNARFVLPMPANTTWVSGAAECVPSTVEVVCSFGDLAKGQSRNRYIYLRPAVAGSLIVTGTTTSDTGDSNMANNSKTVTLTVK
ncbi:cellulase family glycosylhydrolase [Candidatus Thiothrix anitrata]|uniref:Cellulase family glycosylhydrolase n=1 Tax=Candidatus Thiothrix anitrata TaxID=2823902 RepID=A0ABX7X8M1_9GAMM|nr:cellulase family glycosylhydrolase [Candidatus Thiothrix anitrata]QTR51580.1 cellulase family glycosylhydrolase [Candidatus Thiothrix anitrata]